jgi:hypothetical protein
MGLNPEVSKRIFKKDRKSPKAIICRCFNAHFKEERS